MMNSKRRRVTPVVILLAASIHSSQISTFATEDSVKDVSYSSATYALHDAMVASGLNYRKKSMTTFSLSEMKAMFYCSGHVSNELETEFVHDVPGIIDKAIRAGEYDTGRVIETMDQTFEVGENYQTKLKGATLACFVSVGTEEKEAPAAYASYILASTEELQPKTEARAYNLSMFIQADVMELPTGGGMYFIPKKYCLEGLDVGKESTESKRGMSAPEGNMFKDTFPPLLGTKEHERPISLGTKEGTLTSHLTRLVRLISWMSQETYTTEKQYEWKLDLIKRAYNDPKAELLAILEWIKNYNPCVGLNATLNKGGLYDCIYNETKKIRHKYGLSTSFDDTFVASVNFGVMKDNMEIWQQQLLEKYSEPSDEELDQQVAVGIINREKGETLKKDRKFIFYPVPYIFDRNIALQGKNSLYPPLQVNPYYSLESYQRQVSSQYAPLEPENSPLCHDTKNTANVKWSTGRFEGAIKRRMYEHRGRPSGHIAQWAIPPDPFYNTNVLESEYLQQNVSWDHENNLLPGNLTEKVLGRTAKWLMVTPWEDTYNLQDLVEKVQQASSPYSRTASSAYDPGNPCSEAVTNEEIFVFVLSIALAGFGGVHALLETTHRAVHWWRRACCGLPTQSNGTSRLCCWNKLLPTYELLMVLLGMGCFVALYLPLIFQIMKEYEIANFKTEEVLFDVNYSPIYPTQVISINQAALVTLVHVETSCKEARPELLVTLLVIGVAISVIANAPYIQRACEAMHRWCRRCYGIDGVECDDHNVRSKELDVLTPATEDDFRSDASVRSFLTSRSCRVRNAVVKTSAQRRDPHQGSPAEERSIANSAPSGILVDQDEVET